MTGFCGIPFGRLHWDREHHRLRRRRWQQCSTSGCMNIIPEEDEDTGPDSDSRTRPYPHSHTAANNRITTTTRTNRLGTTSPSSNPSEEEHCQYRFPISRGSPPGLTLPHFPPLSSSFSQTSTTLPSPKSPLTPIPSSFLPSSSSSSSSSLPPTPPLPSSASSSASSITSSATLVRGLTPRPRPRSPHPHPRPLPSFWLGFRRKSHPREPEQPLWSMQGASLTALNQVYNCGDGDGNEDANEVGPGREGGDMNAEIGEEEEMGTLEVPCGVCGLVRGIYKRVSRGWWCRECTVGRV